MTHVPGVSSRTRHWVAHDLKDPHVAVSILRKETRIDQF